MKVFILGYPSSIGGAGTECFHTIKLWRAAGCDVSLVPTWGGDPVYREKLDALGCATHHATAETLDRVPGLAGSVVVSFCNDKFVKASPTLRAMGCALVWTNCMTFIGDTEMSCLDQLGPFDAYVFQSEFQRAQLEPTLSAFGYEPSMGHLIRGAFDTAEWTFNYQPRAASDPFWVGRVARPDADKWSSNTFRIYDRINHGYKRGVLLGVDDRTRAKLGAPPWWIDLLPPQAIPVREFYQRIHCLLPVNGGARENWPRAGLEAMACGVPVVAEDRWGWREMIVHGETGFLGGTDEELAHWAAVLAHDESKRRRIANNARLRLICDLANPERLWAAWERVFQSFSESREAA